MSFFRVSLPVCWSVFVLLWSLSDNLVYLSVSLACLCLIYQSNSQVSLLVYQSIFFFCISSPICPYVQLSASSVYQSGLSLSVV